MGFENTVDDLWYRLAGLENENKRLWEKVDSPWFCDKCAVIKKLGGEMGRLKIENKDLASKFRWSEAAYRAIKESNEKLRTELARLRQDQEETIRVLRIMNTEQERTIKAFEKGRDNLVQIIEGA